MQWIDEGIVVGTKRHGEANAIVELMTRDHGRHLGLVRGGAGTRLKPVLQAGNSVHANWRARLEEHLGTYTVEPLLVRSATVLASSHASFGVTHLASLIRLLPERDPHSDIHDELGRILDRIDDVGDAGALVARFELRMLAELGFGLDLESCVATGSSVDLSYVSPKSGRAVSREAGAPWKDRMFRLPAFFANDVSASADDIGDGFALTGYFLNRHVYEPRGGKLSDERALFIAAVARGLNAA